MSDVMEQMGATRILSHGQITDLSAGFKLATNHPFSIMVIEKAKVTGSLVTTPDNQLILVDCKCYDDQTSSDLPVPFHAWTEAAIKFIGIDAIDLVTYDVYWSAGADVDES